MFAIRAVARVAARLPPPRPVFAPSRIARLCTLPDITAQLSSARDLLEKGQLDSAEAAFQSLVNVTDGAASTKQTVEAWIGLASVHLNQRRVGEAEVSLEKAVALAEKAGPSLALAEALQSLGNLLHEQEKLTECAPHYRRVLTLRLGLQGDKHPDVAVILSLLANVLHKQGELEQSYRLYQQALLITKHCFGESNAQVAFVINDIASVVYSQGKLEEALEYYKECVSIAEKCDSRNSALVATCLNNITSVLFGQGKLDEAESVGREALAVTRALYGDDHTDVADCLNNLAVALAQKGSLQAAAESFEEASRIYIAAFGPEHTYSKQTQEDAMVIRLKIVTDAKAKPAST